MGSFHSIQSKDERRRANRLSKPPTSKTVISSTTSSSPRAAAAVAAESPTWQNPWTGTTIPISPPSNDYHAQRSRSLPSASAQSEVPWSIAKGTRTSSIVIEETDESLPQSPGSNFNASTIPNRRASFRPSRQTPLRTATLHSYHHSTQLRSDEPVRSYSLHSLPTKAAGTMHDQALEDATSSNTHFMVDNQGFSLMRRRSLLTRPGVATRRSTRSATQRIPPPIDQEHESHFQPPGYSHLYPQSPLTNVNDGVWAPSTTQLRPPTPTESEYTHLGNLKLGSLRVVNGSVSPCPSDRSQIDQTTSPEIKDGFVQTTDSRHLHRANQDGITQDRVSKAAEDMSMHSRCGDVAHLQNASARNSAKKPSGSFLRISPLSELREYEDVPASPFSFEKSPTTTLHSGQHSSLFLEDEGISVLDEEEAFDHQRMEFIAESSFAARPARLHKKADSGYSSATSVRSLQDGRSRASTDSQGSTRQSSDYRWSTFGNISKNDSCEVGTQLPMHRHLSLQGSRTSFVTEQNGWPQSTSTLCHEPQQIIYNGRIRSLSNSGPYPPARFIYQPQYCAQLRDNHPATDHTHCSPIRRTEEGQQMSGLLKSASETNIAQNSFNSKKGRASRPYKKTSARVWSQRPGIEAPPLPAFPIPQKFEDQESYDEKSSGMEPARGRTRNRSIEFQHRKMTKLQAQKRPDFHLANSPVLFK
ncbi:uncharacterized protein ACLA_088250 [Aspergillus clavatus NRRL 1]|uniref:Uncharacterized protein n=1 Tax=Aspergillus clavatus (strain ATCC 1007 / CBS 513.65 / DSM 816 / NCTC 3887 / NRRL 1 / QM 1276 / 107) TaxID=344612 RepID=A1CE37_ASPCL|nr:uncharacterized protein ACLA_088250 [Aspergillus clavatus NRRL 1]EAW11136.1 hypothetical protein ACLA_088250 [Aspergillus clavatus NRRL 1]